MGLFKLSPTEAIDRELERIDKEMRRYSFNGRSVLAFGPSLENDPTVGMFNELLRQRSELQKTLSKLALKQQVEDEFYDRLD